MNPYPDMLIKHVHHHSEPRYIGTIVAVKDEGRVKFGWSRCNVAKGDKFDRRTGVAKALSRTRPLIDLDPERIPRDLHDDMHEMIDRAANYFRDAAVLETVDCLTLLLKALPVALQRAA